MSTDWFVPLSYMVLGALVLSAVQALARLVPRNHDPESRLERRLDFSARVLAQPRRESTPARYWMWDNLTTREKEIERLVAQGKHNAQVARELQISPYTVETHLKHIYTKLRVTSRTELAHVIQELVD